MPTGRGVFIKTPDQSIMVQAGGLPGPSGVTGQVGPMGPPGTPAIWTRMTQAEYDALIVRDPQTLYVIIG